MKAIKANYFEITLPTKENIEVPFSIASKDMNAGFFIIQINFPDSSQISTSSVSCFIQSMRYRVSMKSRYNF